MAAGRRGELEIFSTSFIDLMCIALAGQLIIWITSPDPIPYQETKKSLRVTITQFGADHMLGELQVWTAGESEAFLSAVINQTPWRETKSHSNGSIITGIRRPPLNMGPTSRSNSEIELMIDGLSDDVRISVPFFRCQQGLGIHPIIAKIQTPNSATTRCILFQKDLSRIVSQQHSSIDALRQTISSRSHVTAFKTNPSVSSQPHDKLWLIVNIKQGGQWSIRGVRKQPTVNANEDELYGYRDDQEAIRVSLLP